MSIDKDTVRKVANLARIEVSEALLEKTTAKMASTLTWVEQLNEVDTDNIEPQSSVMDLPPHWREDVVTDGGIQEKILANAPEATQGYFVVPKVVE
ncbi:MAG: Asp-tRNA(Asn)/Glu-tRNA(Gln) amidotransferase subunit GatC [Alphaproteobacteria bacterium]|nr:Asp-tRNA(Asn)/Glu-tRNA(Gln) amidotransferase subunit GatC [Alphaproteobacteria bacterium]MCD8519948.1 Asp-tRNA(Asn)/Glu-tRNA(Gln) amidotransferase subunit GatC [Alphaproteobacteria bacterium]MCD8526412.1 Asp-tRNA(Asn)/Glu-tRNA(Gln) amidotransferase subunit GatC [Alphaproteobacteria bacterium]MCD8571557.1 Asp-tRNA(Asn)/Glu-tRNA(Gln) amidotransferase subunit GatC [Alphaproteobacteria bacterium]